MPASGNVTLCTSELVSVSTSSWLSFDSPGPNDAGRGWPAGTNAVSAFLGSNLEKSIEVDAFFGLSASIVSRATWVEGEAFCTRGHEPLAYHALLELDCDMLVNTVSAL